MRLQGKEFMKITSTVTEEDMRVRVAEDGGLDSRLGMRFWSPLICWTKKSYLENHVLRRRRCLSRSVLFLKSRILEVRGVVYTRSTTEQSLSWGPVARKFWFLADIHLSIKYQIRNPFLKAVFHDTTRKHTTHGLQRGWTLWENNFIL